MRSRNEDSMGEMWAGGVGFDESREKAGGCWFKEFTHEDEADAGEDLNGPDLDEEEDAVE